MAFAVAPRALTQGRALLVQGMAQGFARVAAAAGERAVVIWSPLAEGLTMRGMGAGPAPPEEDDSVLAAETVVQGERATLSAAAGAADSD